MTMALLVVDVQQGMFMLKRPPFDGEATLMRIAALLERARAAEVPIIHIQHHGGPGHILEPDTPGWPHHPAVAPQAGEVVVAKRHSSAFHDTELNDCLRLLKVETLVIAGMQTEYCVDSACRAGTALGYEVVLASDAQTTFDTPVIPAATIIQHHNETLSADFVTLKPTEEIRFSKRAP